MKVDMNEALRAAATAMEAKDFPRAIELYSQISRTQPHDAALCASQIGAANFFLGNYAVAIQLYRSSGQLGFPAAMVNSNIREAEAALEAVLERANVLRHTQAAPPATDIAHADDARLVAHLEQHLGPAGMVWHEIVSDRIHLDIHHFPPSGERECSVFVTSGVSALPMTVPAEVEGVPRRVELCMLLPADWPIGPDAFKDERNYWPFRLLKKIGRLPHDYATWLGVSHSIPNGDPAVPYAPGVPYTGVVISDPYALPDGLNPLGAHADRIEVLQLIPITTREMQIKLEGGFRALLERLYAEVPERLEEVSRTPRVLA